jgi:hypothetical protein
LLSRARSAYGLRICRFDQSASIPTGAQIVCNGVYVGQRGRMESIDLSSNGTPITSNLTYLVTNPVWIAYQSFSAQPVGDYSCDFSIAGTKLARKTFRVTG